ncbi:MAG: cytochrome C oxidase subunit IV family protein [bacterium]
MTNDAHHPHITPLRTYLGVFLALLVLTAITVTVAQIDFGAWNLVVALIVASIKAILVALIFMHLYSDSKLYFLIFAGALAFLGVFIILTMFDTLRRADIYDEVARPIRPQAAMYDSLRSTPQHGEAEGESAVAEPDSAGFIDSTAGDNGDH